MKKVLKKIFMFLNNIFLFLLGILFSFVPERKSSKQKEEIPKETNSKKNDTLIFRKKEEDTDSEESLELFQEYLKKQKNLVITKEEIEEEFQKIIEKVYEIKVNSLTKENLEQLNDYQKKIIKKINPEKISTKEDLNKILKEKIEKEKEEKKIKNESEKNLEKKIQEKVVIETTPEKTLYSPIKDVVSKEETKKEISFSVIGEEEKITNERQSKITAISPIVLKIDDLEEKKQEEEENTKFIFLEEPKKVEQLVVEEQALSIDDEAVIKPIIKKEKENTQEISKEEINTTVHEEKKTSDPEIKSEKKETKEQKKEERYEEINCSILALETEELIKESTKEMEKEELEEKEYETVEQKIQDRIELLEKLLEKPLKEESQRKIKSEIEKMKNLKTKVKLSKDIDLENTRLALEEGISLEELELIKEKINELDSQNEQERQKAFLKLQYKSAKEINELEKELIKNTLYKTIKRLQKPLFLSFPFLKNKYFRSFVSGLFVFSSFHFLKRILFGTPKHPVIDLSFLKNGSDALKESILLTKNNMASLKELKQMAFLKYPELKNDEEFLLYLSEMERTLKMNYEKLLKQEKTINKYFDKTKNLTRKLKREYRV